MKCYCPATWLFIVLRFPLYIYTQIIHFWFDCEIIFDKPCQAISSSLSYFIFNFNLVIYYGVKSITSISSDIVTEQRANIRLAHKITPQRGWKTPLTSHEIISNHRRFLYNSTEKSKVQRETSEDKMSWKCNYERQASRYSIYHIAHLCTCCRLHMQSCHMIFKK